MDTGGDSATAQEESASKGETTGDATADDTEPGPRPRRIRRRLWLRALLGLLTALAVLVLAAAGYAYWRTDQALDSIDRIPDALPTLPAESQPPRVEGDALVFLLVGLDDDETPEPGPAWQAGAARSDTMMLLQLSGDRETASVVSLPRDTWVEIPGYGEAKLNAAYSWGGPALMVETVQNLTGIRVDHLAVLDWSGFRRLTDAVGGVEINGERLNGEQALEYVRERRSLPGGDFDRTRRQQNFLRALMTQTLSAGTLTDPGRMSGLLGTIDEVVSVDDGLGNDDIRGLAWDLRGMRASDVHFMNAPVAGTDRIEGQSVVLLDEEAAGPLWEAMRDDAMPAFLAGDGAPEQLPDEVR
ncbi:LCP family protein [Streptomyces litchfieldiae]|uniref:LCP family protein n=1 Tax=Streptomyces litchfieldiae TaxID=3075543 RepID=A0ABU2MZ31_9ACTN|nr:LCP family protein [Streptomyces sp. DSM 44938]MDT0346073.1 LCP family protein [Streptomyces sp. DSM 44938]